MNLSDCKLEQNIKKCFSSFQTKCINNKFMQAEDIKAYIELGLPGSKATVEGDGTHFTALVICDQFIGQSRLKKQQMVYDTVRQYLSDGSLHALSIKTFTQEEWQALKQNG